jgi:hypothetical protein
MAGVSAARASYAEPRLSNYEEALKVDPAVAKWIQFAQIAPLGSYPFILEDGPERPKGHGPHAEDGGKFSRDVCRGLHIN